MYFGVGQLRKDSIVAIILTKNRLDSKIQTYSLFAGTKMHGYSVWSGQ